MIAKENWAITKAKKAEKESNASQSSTISSISNKSVGWANSHIIMSQNPQLKTKIILYSGSSTTLFCNKRYCDEIEKTNDSIQVHTNGGTL